MGVHRGRICRQLTMAGGQLPFCATCSKPSSSTAGGFFSSQEIMQVGVLNNSLSIRQKTLSMIELICCPSSLFSFGKGASAPLELEAEL